jgi:flagellar protein FlgJ
MKLSEFLSFLAPYAVRLRLEGSPLFPSVRLAQNLLETGGTIPAWNNLGGIKVGSGQPNEWWDGSSVRKGTWEVVNGVRVDTAANFRAYPSVYHFYKDQDLLFQLPRYERVRTAQIPEEQADMLLECGYATDPAYARKLKQLIEIHDLKQYDREVERVLQELKDEINGLRRRNEELETRVKRLESLRSMGVPEWARAAVDAAVQAGIVDTPEGGSYDFYRLLTVLYRSGTLKDQTG